jgi:hypothetical protein
MLKQFKYALRETIALRLGAFAGVVGVNIVFFALAPVFADSFRFRVSAVIFSCLAFAAVIGCCIAADSFTFRGVFHSDWAAYVHLAPAGGAEILGGRVLTMALADIVNFAAGIAGVAAQGLRMAEPWEKSLEYTGWTELVLSLAMILIAYLMLTLALFFARAMRASVFHSVTGGGILAVLCAAAAVYVLSLIDFALLPMGTLRRYQMFFIITLHFGLNWSMAAFLLLSLIQCAVLFAVTARLIERRINL